MKNRRQIIKLSLVTGIAAATGIPNLTVAQDAESTPAATGTQPNGVLIGGMTDMPEAPDGEIAVVAWQVVGSNAFVLLHNASPDEVILRQGSCNALDASGTILASNDKVNAAPYTLTPSGYGIYQAIFESESGDVVEVSDVAELEITIPTEPMSEATGELINMTCDSLDLDEEGDATLIMTNNSDITVGITPMIVAYFNEDNEIIGGFNEILFGDIGNGGTGIFENAKAKGESSDRFVAAALGSGN